MNLSIIIINFNGAKYIADCLNSVFKACVNLSFEVIVLDNYSTDGSLEIVQDSFPNVKIIESKKNLGFAKGNNLAVEGAKYENLLLLNFDTIVKSDLEETISILETNHKIGAVTIKMLNEDEEWIVSFGKFPNPFRMFRIGNHFDKDKLISFNSNKSLFEVDWVSGSFLLTRKEVYTQVGGLDESYFMYVEDIDYSKKLANLGLMRVFYESASYVHFVGFNRDRESLLIKGYLQYAKKHFKGFPYLFARFSLKINFLVKKIIKRTI